MTPYRVSDFDRDAPRAEAEAVHSRVEGFVAIALVFLAGLASAASGLFVGDAAAGGLGAALLVLAIILLRDELSGVREAHDHDDRRHPRPFRAD